MTIGHEHAHARRSPRFSSLTIRFPRAFPLTPARIPLLVPDMPGRAELEPFLAEMDVARWYTNFGPLLRRFEREIGHLLGASSLTTVANGTFALELGLSALDLPRGAKVLIPALTFVATASAVLRAGLEPVIADVDADSWVLTPAIARAAMKRSRFDCVLPVAAFGCPLPADVWDAFSTDTGVPVLIDAAGAFGNQRPGMRTALAFSLHATKAFGVGEGGIVVSGDAGFVERVRRLSNFGIDASTGFSEAVGSNAKMSEFHAAVGLAALARWPERSRLRSELHRRYLAALQRDCPSLTHQVRPADGVYTIFQVALPNGADRGAVAAALAVRGIETRAWYLPLVPDHPAYAGCESLDLSVARSLGPRLLGLPFHPGLGDTDIGRICATIAGALA